MLQWFQGDQNAPFVLFQLSDRSFATPCLVCRSCGGIRLGIWERIVGSDVGPLLLSSFDSSDGGHSEDDDTLFVILYWQWGSLGILVVVLEVMVVLVLVIVLVVLVMRGAVVMLWCCKWWRWWSWSWNLRKNGRMSSGHLWLPPPPLESSTQHGIVAVF